MVALASSIASPLCVPVLFEQRAKPLLSSRKRQQKSTFPPTLTRESEKMSPCLDARFTCAFLLVLARAHAPRNFRLAYHIAPMLRGSLPCAPSSRDEGDMPHVTPLIPRVPHSGY